MNKFLILCLCIVCLSSCATIFNTPKARVTLASDNVNVPVDISIDGNKKYPDVMLPKRIKIKRGYKPTNVKVEADGYSTTSFNITKKFNSASLWGILFGVVPMAVDAATGAIMKPESKYYNISMHPLYGNINSNNNNIYTPPLVQNRYDKDPTIMAGEADNMVSRDDPGQTALERTIIRWYFDSDPRGARIYWRVVSSIPHIVKNTNETYLMTTPYEETRSFNILGLTYENSRDVQIEIKVSKRGYEDQVKRFNVRQAIDQQEISGFFELVEKPDAE